jgi:hypothetical protein
MPRRIQLWLVSLAIALAALAGTGPWPPPQ